jgi:hypothetical protein
MAGQHLNADPVTHLMAKPPLDPAITARAATSDEVKDLRREAGALKEVVAELTLENRLLKKSMIADGGDEA